MQTHPRRAVLLPSAVAAPILLFLCLGLVLAQATTGGMFGSVTDSSGGIISHAEIRLVSLTTGAQRTVQTAHSGEFVIDGIEPGEYSVSVIAPGFKTLERTGIRLSPSERLALENFSLAVGAVDQHVTVTAEPRSCRPPVRNALPLSPRSKPKNFPSTGGRSHLWWPSRPASSIRSARAPAPSLVPTPQTSTLPATEPRPITSRRWHHHDGRRRRAQWHLRAQYGVDFRNQGADTNYQAEYGRLSGSDVQMVTKSGTLRYHGMAMYYGRNEALNADNFFNNLQQYCSAGQPIQRRDL